MNQSIPHGGTLIDLYDPAFDYLSIHHEIELDNIGLSDLQLIGTGAAYSPLQGFLNEEDYNSVVENMRLIDQTIWSIPIVLPTFKENANKLTSFGTHNKFLIII